MRDRSPTRLAAAAWLAAAACYLASEAAAALAFSPRYSYAGNYISDLGVPACGAVFDGRATCSPLHLLVNVDFGLQAVLFLSAAIAISRVLSGPTRLVFVAFAALNAIGNLLIGAFPETATAGLGPVRYHLVGAVLAIVFGNATAFVSAWAFQGLALPRLHRAASLALPLLAAVALAVLSRSRGAGHPIVVPDGVWERISVYTITSWEVVTAACLIACRR